MADQLTILTDDYTNKETGEEMEGLTVLMEGKVKELFDKILEDSNQYNDHTEIMRDVVIHGINEVLKRK